MILAEEAFSISIPVPHYEANDVVTDKDIRFEIYREHNRFRAIPMIQKEELLTTGLPEELKFVFVSPCISSANDMGEETLNVIKQIILELEEREFL